MRDLRGSALEEGPLRDKLYLSHPVVIDRVILPTRPTKMACEIALQVVTHRDNGTMFVGNFRSGKTTTQIAIENDLVHRLPSVVVFRLIAKLHDKHTETNFYVDLIGDLRLGISTNGKNPERRRLVVNLFKSQTEAKEGNCVVLLVDEAQCWGEREFTLLRDIGNDLRKMGISLVTIIFGDLNLIAFRDAMLKSGRHDLFGRFLMTLYEFPGISSLSELKEFLSGYDDPNIAEYPANSGISYSEFFAPADYRAGWRLADEADLAWAALTSVATRSMRSTKNIGMAWISNAVRNYLFAGLVDPDQQVALSKAEMWLEAVENSGYEASLLAI